MKLSFVKITKELRYYLYLDKSGLALTSKDMGSLHCVDANIEENLIGLERSSSNQLEEVKKETSTSPLSNNESKEIPSSGARKEFSFSSAHIKLVINVLMVILAVY